MKNLILIVTLSLILTADATGQRSVLVDEFLNPNCEDMWARLDNFIIQVRNNPTSRAIVEISGKTDDLRNNLYWEEMVRSYFLRQGIPSDRMQILRTALSNNRMFRFSLTPHGATLPDVELAEWSMEYPRGSRPFVFSNGDSYAVESSVCLDVNEIALLGKVMKANPGARLNVVLIVRSDQEFHRRKHQTIRVLNKYSIFRERIRTFKKIRLKPNPYGLYPGVEYWLLP